MNPSGPCGKCGTRPAAFWWAGTKSSLEAQRNPQYNEAWCEYCCVAAQLEFAEIQARRIPELKAELEKLR